MLTAELIRQIAPRARQDYVDALVGGKEVFEKYGINTPMRMAQFLATILHETGGLTIVRENMNYSASRIKAVWPTRPGAVKFAKNPKALANSVYGARMGNEHDGTNDDDGWRYRGGGMIQLTGKDSYERAGKSIGVALGEHPELIEDAKVSLAAACWEFQKFVKYADKGESGFRAVCNGINRGNPLSSMAPIGWEDRRHWYGKCTECLGACAPVDDTLELGDSGALVKALQERLCALGYAVGKVDGCFGSRTRAAVLAFQAENGLSTDGTIGAETRQALNSESAKPMPLGERASETKEDLKAAGDKTLQTTGAVKAALKTASGLAIPAIAADQTGILDSMGSLVTDLTQYKGVMSGLVSVLQWSLAHWYYAVPLVAYLGYRWMNTVEVQRVLKHNLGFDLSR
jgi:putative chitinase